RPPGRQPPEPQRDRGDRGHTGRKLPGTPEDPPRRRPAAAPAETPDADTRPGGEPEETADPAATDREPEHPPVVAGGPVASLDVRGAAEAAGPTRPSRPRGGRAGAAELADGTDRPRPPDAGEEFGGVGGSGGPRPGAVRPAVAGRRLPGGGRT